MGNKPVAMIVEPPGYKGKDPRVQFSITCTMRASFVSHFLAMLKYMQFLGSVGASRKVAMYCDGDGSFRPKFEWDARLPSDAKPVQDDRPNGIGNRLYDGD